MLLSESNKRHGLSVTLFILDLLLQRSSAKKEDDPVFTKIKKWMENQVTAEKKKKEAEKKAETDAIESSVTGEVKEAKRKDAGKKTKKNPALPATLQATGLENAKSIQDMVAADYGQEYVIMQKGNQYIVTSPKEIGKAVKQGFQSVMVEQNKGFTREFVEANARGPVKNPMTAECRECGHRQELKGLSDKCEKCGSQGKWKSGQYTRSRKATHSCSYRKTKRSKECGGRVVKMKRNGDIYKCEDCNAKYQMR